MAESVIFLREQGIKSVKQLDDYIQKVADERQDLQDKIKAIAKEMQELSATMKQVHTFKNTGNTTRNIRLIRLTRHFLKSINLKLFYMKMPFPSLKNPIPSFQIQGAF